MYAELDSDLHQNPINSSLPHTQCVHQVSSKSVHNFLRYRARYCFWPHLSMVKNHLKNSSSLIRIRIFTKIESVCPRHTPNLPSKFPPNTSTTFLKYPAHKQTEKQTERGENITSFTFGGGGN